MKYIVGGLILGIITAVFRQYWYIELFLIIVAGFGYYITTDDYDKKQNGEV